MARRKCSYGRRRHGRCPPKKSRALGGYTRTCVRYVHQGTKPNDYLRCVEFIDRRGVPVFRGQKHGHAQGVLHSRDRGVSHGRL